MKKLFILAMAFGLAACSTDKTDVPEGGNNEVEANYLSVNLTTTAGSRAEAYEDQTGYVDGSAEETKVNTVRFYFFYANGNASIVDFATNKSYKEWTPANPDGPFADGEKEAPNVEHTLKATIILETTKSAGSASTPDLLLAVLNPNAAVDELGNTPSLDEVKAYIKDLSDNTGGFVMTNSSYVDNSGTVQNVNNLAGFLKDTPAEALDNPVDIYVERVSAKLDMSIKSKATGGEIEVKQIGGSDNPRYLIATGEKSGDKDIYAEFLGWNVTATADRSYLVKSINNTTAWNNELKDTNLFKTANEPWNYTLFFRSFWGVNPASVEFKYGTWNKEEEVDTLYPESETNANPALANKFNFAENTKNVVYMPENAGKSLEFPANAHPTQVIIAARLVDEDGNTIEIAEFGPNRMTVDALKAALLNSLSVQYWREVDGQTGENKYQTITEDDIEFVTAMSLDPSLNDPSTKGRYFVFAQLTKTAAGYTWYNEKPQDNADNSSKEIESTDIDTALKNLGAAKIWKTGMTYYFYNIRHLAKPTITAQPEDEEYEDQLADAIATPGYYGVVRNHVYKTELKTLTGLGTPVYNPDEIIYPEMPNEEKVFLAAEIKVLSWRLVNQDVELEW